MIFNIALFSSLLFIPTAFAVPAGTDAQPRGDRRSLNGYLEQAARVDPNIEYSKTWAGAVWEKNYGHFSSVTGTFMVPTPSGPIGSAVAAWVGIDGDTCNALLQTGVNFTMSSDGPVYEAWGVFYPNPIISIPGISISSGDVIKLNVTASSPFSGTTTIENLTNGECVSWNMTSRHPLCGKNAEWIVGAMAGSNELANFTTVTFTDALATGIGSYTPSGATISNIRLDNQTLTSTSTDGSSVTIQYV